MCYLTTKHSSESQEDPHSTNLLQDIDRRPEQERVYKLASVSTPGVPPFP